MQREWNVVKAKAYPPGVFFGEDGLQITAVCDRTKQKDGGEFGVILYDRKHHNGVRIPFPPESRVGEVYSMTLAGYRDRTCSYLFYCGGQIWQDACCRELADPCRYGVVKKKPARCRVPDGGYDWADDRMPGYPYEDMILYALHVRGFTKHRSSGVEHKGTFLGLTEKIPYLRELGITSVLLMPAYEFEEVMDRYPAVPETMEQAQASCRQPAARQAGAEGTGRPALRLNYWGYQEGLYYVPKSGYSYSRDAVTEYKDMVRALHQNGIEVLMQFYFPAGTGAVQILDILKYWVLEYHIDGFHIMGIDLPVEMIAREPLLSETKLLTTRQYVPEKDDYMLHTRRLGWLDDGFLYDMRRSIKGDDNMVNQLLYHIRNNREENGIINYIAKWDGMRLADLVSYDRKHNEANGEENQDGTDYNCSWNCGVEGRSRRKAIGDLRLRQMKNAMSLVFLSQGTPLLYSGDEFANSQEGNNNPYCQDNAVGWIKWNMTESGAELLAYTKRLIKLRREHAILHSRKPLSGMDYLSCGYPDISYHGREAWRPDTSPASRSVGVMYCGSYGDVRADAAAQADRTNTGRTDGTDNAQAGIANVGRTDGKDSVQTDGTLFYIGMNFHWNAYELGLPQLPKGKEWVLYCSTDRSQTADSAGAENREDAAPPLQEVCIGPRTVAVYVTKDVPLTAPRSEAAPRRKKNGRKAGKNGQEA